MSFVRRTRLSRNECGWKRNDNKAMENFLLSNGYFWLNLKVKWNFSGKHLLSRCCRACSLYQFVEAVIISNCMPHKYITIFVFFSLPPFPITICVSIFIWCFAISRKISLHSTREVLRHNAKQNACGLTFYDKRLTPLCAIE